MSVEQLGNKHYEITTRISVYSETANSYFEATGIKTTYEVKLIDDEYKIVDTSLFTLLNEGLGDVFKLVLIMFGVIGGIGTIITIVAIVIEKKKRKKFQQQYMNNQAINN